MRLPKILVVATVGGVLGVSACGGEDETSSSTTAPTATAPAATATAEADSPTSGAKVDANTATQEEIAAALTDAGVDNAEQWAREVEEYRQYPPDDPGFAKLRDELAKYNPGEGVVDKIVGALSL